MITFFYNPVPTLVYFKLLWHVVAVGHVVIFDVSAAECKNMVSK